jgi:hypothetical protein
VTTQPQNGRVAGHFAERHFAERHFCQTDFLPKGQLAENLKVEVKSVLRIGSAHNNVRAL